MGFLHNFSRVEKPSRKVYIWSPMVYNMSVCIWSFSPMVFAASSLDSSSLCFSWKTLTDHMLIVSPAPWLTDTLLYRTTDQPSRPCPQLSNEQRGEAGIRLFEESVSFPNAFKLQLDYGYWHWPCFWRWPQHSIHYLLYPLKLPFSK